MQFKTSETQTTVTTSRLNIVTLDAKLSTANSLQAESQAALSIDESALEVFNQEREYYNKLVGNQKKSQSWGSLLLKILIIYCSTFSLLGFAVTVMFPSFLNCSYPVQNAENRQSVARSDRPQPFLVAETAPISR